MTAAAGLAGEGRQGPAAHRRQPVAPGDRADGRLQRARRRAGLLAGRRVAAAFRRSAQPAGRAGQPLGAAWPDPDRQRRGPGAQQRSRRDRRARLPVSGRRAHRRLQEPALRHRRPRARLRPAAHRPAHTVAGRRILQQVPRRQLRPGRPRHVARRRPATGRGECPGQRPRRGGRHRAVDRPRAGHGQQPDLRSQPHRRSGQGQGLP